MKYPTHDDYKRIVEDQVEWIKAARRDVSQAEIEAYKAGIQYGWCKVVALMREREGHQKAGT